MKYRIGDKILFNGKVGYVVDLVNPDDKSKYRYHISSAGWLWSVAEHEIHQPNSFKA